MKKRFWSLLLVFSMVFCLLLPFGAFAQEQDRGADCYAFLKNYLLKNGKSSGGVYTYSGVEANDDMAIDITVTYDPKSDQLRFGLSQKQGLASYSAEVAVPSTLKMPYDASQTLTYIGVISNTNKGQIGADFTTESNIPLSGETYDTEDLFPFAIALALRHAQDNLLYGSGYTIADLGFTALFAELYGGHTHETALKNAKEATCTEPGYTGDKVCKICGETVEQGREIPASGHKTETIRAKAATCTEAGYTGDKVCTVCGETVETGSAVPALGHLFDDGVVTKEPTATENGVRTFTCTRCGETRTESIPKLDCPHDYQLQVVAPTCTEDGYTLHVCSICGASFKDSFTVAAGHSTQLRGQKDADCEHAGYTGDLVCTVCGEIVTPGRELPALGHKTELRNAKAATETEAGYTGDEVCTVCGKTVKQGEIIPALGPKTCDGGSQCPSRIFTDVDRTLWYHLPIDWAVTNKVTTGLSAKTFGPDASCTRAQMVTFLWRAVGEPEPKLQSSSFVDVPAGQYYAKAVLWALENGITTGMDAKHFSPDATVTRAQTVTFLWRLKHEPAPTGTASFPDVPADAYYAAAVRWAVENKITNGTGKGLFEPESNCTRAQIVTFLYRAVAG